MALHFSRDEFDHRIAQVQATMEERNFDAILLFAQESMYWLTGYDTFGFCFFQCLVVKRDGQMVLLTRAPDLRQARHTSLIEDIRLWVDRERGHPSVQLRDMLHDIDLLGAKLGVEYDTHGLTAAAGKALDETLTGFADLSDASDLIPRLRLIKSWAEIEFIRDAAKMADKAFHAGMENIVPAGNDAAVLAAMQNAILSEGGDYPANEFIIGSGADALLCRYKSGRRVFDKNDQITLEFAGVAKHYHAALMRTVIIGKPNTRQVELFDKACEALMEVEAVMRPDHTFGDVFTAHRRVFDNHGLKALRMNACGYSLGARFAPSWMDWPMFYEGNDIQIEPNMSLFAHMILMDSEAGLAMTLGRTYLTTENDPEPLSTLPIELVSVID